jgi:hypothetical protein
MNLALVAFNLIPGYPLDGGRVFRSVVWAITKNMRQSTVIAGNMGRGFGFLFILIGVWRMFSGDLGGGMWIAFIGWFLESAASAQINQAVYQGLLTGHSVSQAMSTQRVSIPADLTLQQLVDEHVLGTGRRCFLVTSGTTTVGLMTLHRIKEVSRADWTETSVSQAMLPLDELRHVSPATDLFEALQLLAPEGVNQLPLMTGRQVVGMLSREDVIS